ncbi:MAG: M20/M25/M40 family metallo-hydrolase, partial [Anaerolineae bacterium]|nr:M20/M25/M40 family metallo-hydrolase [Anaerolineae bacterium]
MSHNENERADALLTGLVERYSPSTQERSAVAFLVQQMTDLGFQAQSDGAGNAVGSLGDGRTTILLLGHIDTVPGYISVRREGSLLYGRGTVDAKGPLATFVAAAAAGPLPGKRVVVAGAVEEESATSRGARYLLDRLTPDAVVIGEPSQWDRVTVGYKGRLLVDYTLRREIGHTAGPNGSVSEAAFGFWAGVQAYVTTHNEGQQRMFSRLSPSLRAMNSVGDGFTETATLTIGFRLPPDFDAGALQSRLTELAGDGRLRFRGLESAYHAPKNTRLARAFVKAIDAEGSRVQFKVKSGTSDMNVVGPVWRCPILAYGPGNSQ